MAAGDRDPELVGDLLVGEVVHVFQHDDAAQLRRQLVERERDPLERLRRLRHRFRLHLGRLVGRLDIVVVGLRLLAAPALRTCVAAALAVMRYIQVENAASPRNLPMPRHARR